MKIKNDLISIKIGDKKYDFNNLILDAYLKKFVSSQLEKNSKLVALDKKLNYCLIKFDIPFEEVRGNTELHNQDFDICFIGDIKYEQMISENQITVQYLYNNSQNASIYDYSRGTANEIKISDYYNRKIVAIGFNSFWANDTNAQNKYHVSAVLDTSNYNIYLQENQDISITRKDIITTDAIFYSNSKKIVPGPAHLAPFGLPQIIPQNNIYNSNGLGWTSFNNEGKGILYSIGLSSYPDYIDKELVLGVDVKAENNGTELIIKGIENYLNLDNSLFCNPSLYPNLGLYPTKSNYKYVIFKYKVWQLVHTGTFENVIETNTDTGYYYYQAIPIDKFGKMNLKIKYERG